MNFNLPQALEILRATPAVLDAMLRGKSDAWLTARKTPDAFNSIDVLGHLIHAEQTDWMPRVRILLEHGEARAFDPFDRFAFQNIIAGKSIEALLDEFARERAEGLQALASLNLTEADFFRQGRHPEFGPVTLGNLLATWSVHDQAHIAQIARTLASAYKQAVGPWLAYTSILN